MTLSSNTYSNSAILFSSSLLQRLEGHERLPTTYIGVRRVRDPPSTSSSTRRRPPPPLARQDELLTATTAAVSSNGSNKEDGGHDDDAWVPNELMTTTSARSGDENYDKTLPPPPSSSSSLIRLTDQYDEGNEEENERTIQQNSKVAPIIFRITNPNDDDDTTIGRRMTSREKKQFKYQLKQAQQSIRKEERQRQHEQRIQEAKNEKAERKRVKRLAWQAKKQQQSQQQQQQEQPPPRQQQANDEQAAITTTTMCNSMAKVPAKQVDHNIPKDDAPPPPPPSVTVPTATRKGAGPAAALPPTPAMLTPAATTCFIRDLGLFLPPVALYEQHSDNISSTTASRFRRTATIMDSDLSTQWANKLLHTALTPVDVSRSKEEMRPMAYRLVPEVWTRLCPDSLWTVEAEAVPKITMEDADAAATAAANAVALPNSSTEPNGKEGDTNIKEKQTQIHQPMEGATTTSGALPSLIATTTTTTCYIPNHDYAFAQLRSTTSTSSYDEDASLIVQHLHHYSNLHIACGAIFGCDFLLYDGPRDVRHSFAGLRIYCCKSSRKRSRSERRCDNMDEEEEGGGSLNDQLPVPSAYDMAGFVRTMNSARKIALLATVIRDEDVVGVDDYVDNSPPRTTATTLKPTYRIAIVDLALEKVLTAPTHVRKGNTTKRRSEEDAANGLAKRKV
ncbi:hypothetical protein ACHAWU_002604 [Discostella pseudostelligera]|uniref:Uncharacterized protein n=1 Tax=Discostella pseudostelligera TaxID=259834 RepID=A0ABD3MRW2_9STRA